MSFWEDFPNRVFVFGSNRQGIHGAGAALFARTHWAAVPGVGEGFRGWSYALPTKTTPRSTSSWSEVRVAVDRFLDFADARPDLTFQVTAVGCGLAGFDSASMAPLFRDAPDNCLLPGVWRRLTRPQDYTASIIVAGSRDQPNPDRVFEALDREVERIQRGSPDAVEIVSGMARGADRLGAEWAKEAGFPIVEFPAEWDRFGKSAGFIRNQEMSWCATHLLAFWDGASPGTRNMISAARRDGLDVRVIRQ